MRRCAVLPLLLAALLARAEEPPKPPAGLVRYLTGDPADAVVETKGPGVILMGGGKDVDDAFRWWRDLIAGGDVVILRTSGKDGYNRYLFEEIGGCDSVETLLVTSRELANSDYVAWRLRTAEGIFLAGGDQATYLRNWTRTAVQTNLQQAWRRGAVLGGTSAGCAVLGEFAFGARGGTIRSKTALADPFHERVTLERRFLRLPPLANVITDTHFSERERLGRLTAFLARIRHDGWSKRPLGIGVDSRTALCVDREGRAEVFGARGVHLVQLRAATLKSGAPLSGVERTHVTLKAGDTVRLKRGHVERE